MIVTDDLLNAAEIEWARVHTEVGLMEQRRVKLRLFLERLAKHPHASADGLLAELLGRVETLEEKCSCRVDALE